MAWETFAELSNLEAFKCLYESDACVSFSTSAGSGVRTSVRPVERDRVGRERRGNTSCENHSDTGGGGRGSKAQAAAARRSARERCSAEHVRRLGRTRSLSNRSQISDLGANACTHHGSPSPVLAAWKDRERYNLTRLQRHSHLLLAKWAVRFNVDLLWTRKHRLLH